MALVDVNNDLRYHWYFMKMGARLLSLKWGSSMTLFVSYDIVNKQTSFYYV